MCSAHSLIVFNNDVKFRDNISNGIRLMERTRDYEALMDVSTDIRIDGRTYGRKDGH